MGLGRTLDWGNEDHTTQLGLEVAVDRNYTADMEHRADTVAGIVVAAVVAATADAVADRLIEASGDRKELVAGDEPVGCTAPLHKFEAAHKFDWDSAAQGIW